MTIKIFSDHLKSGIYKITNDVNGKVYVGSTINIKTRWGRHRRHLCLDIHHNPHLQNAWNKYGADVFMMTVLENCPADELIAREAFHIDAAQSCNPEKGYNVMAPADGRLTHSIATRQKLRAARLKQGVIPHTPAKLFEHDGQSKSAKEWADHFGVNYTTFRQKLGNGLSVAEASKTKPKERRVEFNGESMSLKAAAKKASIHYKCLWSRMKTGISVDEALSKKSLKEIARQNKVNYSTFFGRLSRGMSVEEAMALPVKRRNRVTIL